MTTLDAPRSAKSVWLISFGDLLTLLVAYFVLALGFKIKEHQHLNTQLANPSKGGTLVAVVAPERTSIVEESVLFDTQVGVVRLPESLKSHTGEVVVETCGSGNVNSGEMGRRIVRELPSSASLKEVKILGKNCEGITYFTPVTGKVVAVVRILKAKSNG